MTGSAIEALQADRDALLEICEGLSDDEWHAVSGWADWTVSDLISHLAGGFWLVVDRSMVPDTTGLPTQQGQDAIVESRRGTTRKQVIDDYQMVSRAAIDQLSAIGDDQRVRSFGPLGSYPSSMVANSFAFDHYAHIRIDLFAPRGPLVAAPPPSDLLRLEPALDWIEAALPQQNAELVVALPGSLEIDVSGPAARTITVGTGPASATIENDAPSLIRWITQRGTWDELAVSATGDAETLETARQLQVS